MTFQGLKGANQNKVIYDISKWLWFSLIYSKYSHSILDGHREVLCFSWWFSENSGHILNVTLDSWIDEDKEKATEVDSKAGVYKIKPLPLIRHSAISWGAILQQKDNLT